MAESSGEKTEKPTGKKRDDARKEGNVPQSKEITIAVTMVVSFYAFKLFYSMISRQVMSLLTDYIELVGYKDTFTRSDAQDFFIKCVLKYAVASFPILLITVFAAFIVSMAQTKMLVNFKSIRPKFSRMNPLEGIKKLFSLKGLLEVLKSVLKIFLLIYIIYICIRKKIRMMPGLIDCSLVQVAGFTSDLIFDIINKMIIAFVVLAVADYIYQRLQYEKNLRMTKQEVKEEYKSTEGDPQIKGRIKSKQREISQRRMLQSVPEADVIIRNPTHFAVALKYDLENSSAPVVVAKGQDYIALKIVDIAEQNGVAVIENVPLARSLYAAVDIGREIPAEFYNSVAEILAYVFSKEKKDLK